jgi:CBS domain-containing protein
MQTRLVTVSPDSSLFDAASLLARHRISGLPVVDADGKAVGVITLADLSAFWLHHERDVAEQELSFYRTLCGQTQELAAYFAGFYREDSQIQVGDVMTPRILHVSEDTLVTEIMRLLGQHHMHRVFVSRDSKLIGVVTTVDGQGPRGRPLRYPCGGWGNPIDID